MQWCQYSQENTKSEKVDGNKICKNGCNERSSRTSSWIKGRGKHYSHRLNGANDTFRGIVSGTIRGARTVRINPNGGDTYEVVLK